MGAINVLSALFESVNLPCIITAIETDLMVMGKRQYIMYVLPTKVK